MHAPDSTPFVPGRRSVAFAAFAAAAVATAPAAAQCRTIDFDDHAPGTVITTQYPGVTFSVSPGSCGGGEPLPRIADLGAGAASGSQGLAVPFGCPDFGPDTLVIVFDDPQRAVSFTVGGSIPGPFEAAAISTPSGIGVVIDFVTVQAGTDARTLVQLGDPDGAPQIRRVTIRSTVEDQEIIDDLTYEADPTPPVAELEDIDFRACVCDSIEVRGIACDPDGTYVTDRLEYRAVDADPSDPWILYDEAFGDICSPGLLYFFNRDMLPQGHYYLRLTVENECGLTASDTATVYVDRTAPFLDVQRPFADFEIVCGTYDVVGQIWDHCGPSWTVTAQREGDPQIVIANGNGDRCGVLASWDTTTAPEGTYLLRVSSSDDCLQLAVFERMVVVDRGACGMPDLNGDGVVNFSDLLILLAAWS